MIANEKERGATAVVAALLFLVLLTFVGLAVDVGGAFAKRQEAQNGADAAALAVAAQCLEAAAARDCPDDYLEAERIALQNERTDESADVLAGDIQYDTPAPYHVTVTVTAEHDAWFLPAATDLENFTVKRSATVNFGSPTSGITTLPIIVSECLFPGVSGGPAEGTTIEIWLPQNAVRAASAPTGGCEPDYPAGGFGWLQGTGCTAEIGVDDTVSSDTGISTPSACHQAPRDANHFRDMVARGTTVIIPLFEVSSGTGINGTYKVTRFAVFQMTGFQSHTGTLNDAVTKCAGPRPSWASGTCFQGKFLTFIDDPGDFELGGPITELTFARLVG